MNKASFQSILGALSPSTAEVKKIDAAPPLAPHAFKTYTGTIIQFSIKVICVTD